MARRDSNPSEILLALKARLIDQVDSANDVTCIINADPDQVPEPMPGEFHYVITPSPSFTFDDAMFTGGGQRQCTTNWIFAVTVHSRNNQDHTGSDEIFITSKEFGVFYRIGEVLKALAEYDLTDEHDNPILNQPIYPYSGNFHRPTEREGSVQIGFSLQFDWDLEAVYP